MVDLAKVGENGWETNGVKSLMKMTKSSLEEKGPVLLNKAKVRLRRVSHVANNRPLDSV
jgi:hypothetical protein